MKRSEQSTIDLAEDVVHDARELVGLEFALARREIRDLLVRNGVAIGLLALGSVFLILALLVALPVVLVLWWSNHIAGALIWLGTYLVLAAVLALIGRLMLRFEPPPKTLATLKETREWVLRQISSNGR